MTPLLVAVGAAVGSALRYLAGYHLDGERHLGTLLVNLLGSLALGALFGAGSSGWTLALLGTGFCGGFTTYSAFAVQTVGKGPVRGTAYVVATVLGCLATAAVGYLLAG